MKNTTQHPLKRTWSGPIDKWEIPFNFNGLKQSTFYPNKSEQQH